MELAGEMVRRYERGGSGEVAGRSDSGGWTRRVATSNISEKRLQVIGEQGERGWRGGAIAGDGRGG
jgi:hypothetical protein